FRLLDKGPGTKTHILIRAAQNRSIIKDEDDSLPTCLFEFLDTLHVSKIYDFELKASGKKRIARKTKVEIRFSTVNLAKSSHCHDDDVSSDIELYAIDVREKEELVPKGEKRLHWRLLTSHEIETVEQACECIG